MQNHQYGRGKFDAHPDYISYMHYIVEHNNYLGMPNAKSEDGRINWQVSSGKNTSFYEFYKPRKHWWIRTADSLGLPGRDSEAERFSVAARLIHPTGYRPCRLCGEKVNVGYFYLNKRFANKLSKDFPKLLASPSQPIDDVLKLLLQVVDRREEAELYLERLFPERTKELRNKGPIGEAFLSTAHIRSYWLSPGFMANPPDRLDGFHDYCLFCRKDNDPGRSDANLRSYNHDRRCFAWWAEGNWALADALYNNASSGHCAIKDCTAQLEKVSPDHVGPLACGFKQMPLFIPTCPAHNSAKNRRFTFSDVQVLLAFEKEHSTSVASWQVRAHWNKHKTLIKNDDEAKVLSNSLRSLQDTYMRVLWDLFQEEQMHLLVTFLNPDHAFLDFTFEGLDPAKLIFKNVKIRSKNTFSRQKLASRAIRIAFESLAEYNAKPAAKRNMVRDDYQDNISLVRRILSDLPEPNSDINRPWVDAIIGTQKNERKEHKIRILIEDEAHLPTDDELYSRGKLQKLFDAIGEKAPIDFSHYLIDQ